MLLRILPRMLAMTLEPLFMGGEIVLRRLGQLLRPGDGPPRGGDLRVDKADDVQPVETQTLLHAQAGAMRLSPRRGRVIGRPEGKRRPARSTPPKSYPRPVLAVPYLKAKS